MNAPFKTSERPVFEGRGMSNRALRQPDDPGTGICPCCGQLWPDQDGDVEKFLRRNAGHFPPAHLARFLSWPLERLQRFAGKARPPIDLTLKKEPEPRGA